MKKVKSIMSLLLVLVIVIAMTACGSSSGGDSETSEGTPKTEADTNNSSSGSEASKEEVNSIYADVEPLETSTKLTFGMLNGSHHGFPIWLTEQLGGYEAAGIEPEYAVFNNGPVMVESLASDSWDCGSYGIGGTLTGVIGQDAIILGASANDNGSLNFFAYPDDPIVEAGKNVSESPKLYGTKETWKGREIFLPTGTTLHYTLGKALEKFGLKDTDVQLTHMDVTSGNTALRAGKGEIVGLWGNFSYAPDMSEKFVRVINSPDVGVELMTTLTANPRSYADPEKTKAIKKWMELYFLTVNWIQENQTEAAQLFAEWDESVGVKTTPEECLAYMKDNPNYTLEENYKMATEMATIDGNEMTELEAINYRPLQFFVEKGNYEPDSLDKLIAGNFKTEYIKELYDEAQK